MKKAIGAILILTVLITGCGGKSVAKTTPTPTLTPTPTVTEAMQPTPVVNEPPMDVSWISPAKIEVGNLYAGALAEYTLKVHNGNDAEALFTVMARMPDNVTDGYSKPTTEMLDWVSISGAGMPLAPYETKEVTVSLAMPEGATAPDKWEFWISVIDNSQSGFVKVELCAKWLITME